MATRWPSGLATGYGDVSRGERRNTCQRAAPRTLGILSASPIQAPRSFSGSGPGGNGSVGSGVTFAPLSSSSVPLPGSFFERGQSTISKSSRASPAPAARSALRRCCHEERGLDGGASGTVASADFCGFQSVVTIDDTVSCPAGGGLTSVARGATVG